MATPEPVQILHRVTRPDRSIDGYLLALPAGGYRKLEPDDPLLVGRPPATPEVNGGYRLGEQE